MLASLGLKFLDMTNALAYLSRSSSTAKNRFYETVPPLSSLIEREGDGMSNSFLRNFSDFITKPTYDATALSITIGKWDTA